MLFFYINNLSLHNYILNVIFFSFLRRGHQTSRNLSNFLTFMIPVAFAFFYKILTQTLKGRNNLFLAYHFRSLLHVPMALLSQGLW